MHSSIFSFALWCLQYRPTAPGASTFAMEAVGVRGLCSLATVFSSSVLQFDHGARRLVQHTCPVGLELRGCLGLQSKLLQ